MVKNYVCNSNIFFYHITYTWFYLTFKVFNSFKNTLLIFFQNLLEVVHDLFEEQTSLEKVILKTMQRAQKLLKCERAAVLLVDELDSSEVGFFNTNYIFI